MLFGGVINFCCSNHSNKSEIPVRPNNIPYEAFWAGGTDGGNWYLVDDIHNHRNSVKLKVFSDNDGSLIVAGKFVILCPNTNITFIQDLKNQISSFDGEKIYLKASAGKKPCWLQILGH